MSFLLERDALNGKSGSGFLKINGENHIVMDNFGQTR